MKKWKYTHEEYVAAVAVTNPNIEILGKYTGGRNPILCKCKECGHQWSPNASEIKTGKHGCPKCKRIRGWDNRRTTREQFLEKLSKLCPTIESAGEYLGTEKCTHVRCKVCGYEWDAKPYNLYYGKGCPKCAGNLPVDPDYFKRKVESNGKVKVISRFQNMSTKVTVQCNKCGRIWDVHPNIIHNNVGCQMCAAITNGEKLRLDHETFIKEAGSRKASNVRIVGRYSKSTDPIDCECTVCGFKWSPQASNVLSGAGCPHCVGMYKTQQEFVDEVKKVNPQVEIIGAYKHNKDRIKCRCKDCGFEWAPVASSLRAGFGCPACCCSHGERDIRSILDNNHIKYVTPKSFDGLVGCGGGKLSYDFFIPSLNLLIEYQGEQHYRAVDWFGGEEKFKSQKEHDKRKREYANQNGYTLIEIKYDEDIFQKLQTVLNLESVTTTGAA